VKSDTRPRTLVHRELKRIANLTTNTSCAKNEVMTAATTFDVDIVTAKGVGSVISATTNPSLSIERHRRALLRGQL
jgi:hypothetical protein